MRSIQRWIRELFSLSHSQANGLLILFPLMLAILFSEPAWRWYIRHRKVDHSADIARLDSIIASWRHYNSLSRSAGSAGISKPDPGAKLFHFNPNTVDSTRLIDLGFSAKMASRVIRYRLKGGKFKIRQDVRKIYGLDSAFYSRLYPFIDLPTSAVRSAEKVDWRKGAKLPFVKEVVSPFDINQADTGQLKKIRGIGDKLSLRLVRYRDALGGFITLDQLTEIYGLDTVVISRIREKTFIKPGFVPRHLNINVVSEKELADHPYLERSGARSIVAYRFQHGNFKSLEDLGKIGGLDQKAIRKLIPYLTTDKEMKQK